MRVSVADDATVADVLEAVRHAVPQLALPERPLVAVNHQYATHELCVDARDEIALIPPVAGG